MQTLLVFLIFAAALTYLGYRTYRSFARRNAGCGKGCGCADATSTTAKKTTTFVG